MLVTLCYLVCMSVFHIWSLSLDYILLISTIILVPFITLSKTVWCLRSGNQGNYWQTATVNIRSRGEKDTTYECTEVLPATQYLKSLSGYNSSL